MAQYRSWRKKRKHGSWPHYAGFHIPGGERDLLVVNLSHGWRVMEITDPQEIQFENIPAPIEVDLPAEVENEIRRFLEADKRFQTQTGPLLEEITERIRFKG